MGKKINSNCKCNFQLSNSYSRRNGEKFSVESNVKPNLLWTSLGVNVLFFCGFCIDSTNSKVVSNVWERKREKQSVQTKIVCCLGWVFSLFIYYAFNATRKVATFHNCIGFSPKRIKFHSYEMFQTWAIFNAFYFDISNKWHFSLCSWVLMLDHWFQF